MTRIQHFRNLVAAGSLWRRLALLVVIFLPAAAATAQTFSVVNSFDSVASANGYNPVAPLAQGPDGTLYGTASAGGSHAFGMVYKVQPDGTGYSVLWNFSGGSDGGTPDAGLVLAGDTLYGTAYTGGSSGYGIIFAVNTDGRGFTNLYSFTGGLDCGNPYAGMILSGGTLYGTTTGESSAIQNYGSIFKISTNGSGFTVLKTFEGGDGANPYGGLLLSGNLLYGTTESGTPGYGTVFRVSIIGTDFTTLYSFTDGNDGGNPYGGLLLAGSELFGTTQSGGTNGLGTVFKLSTSGGSVAVLHSFDSASGHGYGPEAGLTLAGNILYGTTEYGGSSPNPGGMIFALSTNGSGFTVLHNFNGTNDGSAPEAALHLSGNTLYGTTTSGGGMEGGTLFSLTLFGPPVITRQPVSQIVPAGGTATFGVGVVGATPLGYQWMSNNIPLTGATNASLTLANVSLADSASAYSVSITNIYNNLEFQTSTGGTVLSGYASLTVLPVIVVNQPYDQIVPVGSTVTLNVETAATVPVTYQWNSNNVPLPAATNGTLILTNVTLADAGNYSVLVADTFGSVLSSNALLTVLSLSSYQPPTYLFQIDASAVTNGGIEPTYLALDTGNNLYVSDYNNGRIIKFTASGGLVWVGISGNDPFGLAVNRNILYATLNSSSVVAEFNPEGDYLTEWGSYGAGNGQFEYPEGIAVDSNTNVYVVDTDNDRIEKFDSNGAYLNQWGGYGAGNGQFEYPAGIAVDSNNNVYVVDTDNDRIEKFDSNGAYLKQWGSDGSRASQFVSPVGIAVDNGNYVYVVDSGNNRVEKFDVDGDYLAQWGNAGDGNGEFDNPEGIAVDSTGNFIYVADSYNSRIQVFANDTSVVPPIISSQPTNQIAAVDRSVTFSVGAVGAAPLAYQWNSNNVALPGATNATLTLTNLSLASAATFSVLITNNYGSTLSNPAILTVLPDQLTLPASGISANSAVLNGSVTIVPGDTLTWFEWGTDTNYGNIAGITNLPNLSETVSISDALDGLNGDLIYHYRVVVTNDSGFLYGNDQLFQVGLPPTLNMVSATTQTNSAVLSATVNPDGRDTTVFFSCAGATTLRDAGSGSVATELQIPIAGLTPGRLYTYMAQASNSAGTVSSASFTFQALPWNFTTAPVANWQAIGCSADGQKLAAAPYGGYIYTSTNAGITWSQSGSFDASWSGLASSADGSRLVATTGGLFLFQSPGDIFTSTNSGQLWTISKAPFWHWDCVASSADGNRLAAVATGGGVAISTNAGVSWLTNNVPAALTNWLCVAVSADGNTFVVAVNQGLVYSSTNAGNTWAANNLPATNWQSVASSADGSKLVAAVGGYSPSVAAGNPGPIFTTTNAGATWTMQTNAPIKDWFCVASSADGNKLAGVVYGVFTGFTNSIYTSTDAGLTWHVSDAPANAWEWVASSADGNKLAAVANSNNGYNGGAGKIYTLEITPSPVLSLSVSNNTLVSWIIPSQDFILQQSPDLVNWTGVTNPPVLNLTNLQNQVVLPMTNGNSFYRLQGQ